MAKATEIFTKESLKIKDFLRYFLIVIKEGLPIWILYVLIINIFERKNTKFVVMKKNEEMVGGFFITDFPLVKYKPYLWFDKEAQFKINSLKNNGYKYFCCFVVIRKFRNIGVGTFALNSYFNDKNTKIYFTSSPRVTDFYLRNGAKLFLKSKYTVYLIEK